MNTSTVADKIIALEKHAMREWLNGDPSAFLNIYSQDYTYFDPSLEWKLEGFDKIKAIYDSIRGMIKEESFEILNPSVQVYGEMAVLAYNLHIHTGDKCWKENVTEVYRNEESGDWKIIHSHFSMTQPK